MSAYWMWWIAAAALVAAELLTGTFYLLVVGIVMLQRWKRDLALRTPAQQGLDIGQMVQVQSWGPDGTARVAYRGSTWDAELAATGVPQAKTMYIAAMRGSVLILSDRRPDAPQQP